MPRHFFPVKLRYGAVRQRRLTRYPPAGSEDELGELHDLAHSVDDTLSKYIGYPGDYETWREALEIVAERMDISVPDCEHVDLSKFRAELIEHFEGGAPGGRVDFDVDSTEGGIPPKNRKRSTHRGEARNKLISTLTKHHRYANGSCLNSEPIRVNELARQANVSKSTASVFFKEEFKGHDAYRTKCQDTTILISSLKMLNGEFSPHILYGAQPPGETERDDDR